MRNCAVLSLLAGLTAACSVSFPMTGLKTDDTPTGSIDRTASLFPAALDREDLRRAKAALATALDPQGNGQRVVWQNPQTGSHGAFTASAPPFADQDRVCRAFSGEVSPSEAGDRHLTGSACRDADGSWVLRPAGGSDKA